ncbi:phosphatase PAP2 family protein [Candidatus Dojkabacteria bacterium]|nr:phosphatase PAP2 family protein [Candidatus Dojkabacteria bacterium]
MEILGNIQEFIKKYKWFFFSFYTVVLLYLIFVTKRLPSPDIIFVIIWGYAVIFGQGKKFVLDWWPFAILFIIYEYSRGAASLIHEIFNISVHKETLYIWEKALFGENIPTYWFQDLVGNIPTVIDVFAFVMYTSFFWFAVVAAFIIWIFNKKLFTEFKLGYLFLSYAGYITYILFPAYPPWLAAEEGIIQPIKRTVWEVLPAGKSVTAVFHEVGYNPVAPFPSLHCGWAVFVAIMFDRLLQKKFGLWAKLSYLYPVAMIFTVVYTGDHYIVDAIAGIIYAFASVWIVSKICRIKPKKLLNINKSK